MQFLTRLAALAAVAAPFLATAAPFKASEVVKGKYIIQLKPGVDVATVAAHHHQVRDIHRRNVLSRRDLSGDAPEAGGIENEYGFGDFVGYSGGFDEATIEELRQMPEVSHSYTVIVERGRFKPRISKDPLKRVPAWENVIVAATMRQSFHQKVNLTNIANWNFNRSSTLRRTPS